MASNTIGMIRTKIEMDGECGRHGGEKVCRQGFGGRLQGWILLGRLGGR